MRDGVCIKSFNTFSIDVCAKRVIVVYNEYSLLQLWKQFSHQNWPILVLGGGSNVLFLKDYDGIIILNRIKGIVITEYEKIWRLHIGAGEKWDELVRYTLSVNIPGLENLAGIPGYVGAAPIQNIGAYGVEFSQFCEYVDVLDVNNEERKRFTATECNFKYRNSIFQEFPKKYVVIFVGLQLSKIWKPILSYYGLDILNIMDVTPYQIFKTICRIRNKKIPNPVVIGNAGSFFKNPIVEIKIVYCLLQMYPNMPFYYQTDGNVKLSAGWLIEYCQLKGCTFGEVAVYARQSLILINSRQIATGTEIAALAVYIHRKVLRKFNIYLQPEVKFISSSGEVDLKKLFT